MKLDNKQINKVIKVFLIFLEKISNFFFTYHNRPKYVDGLNAYTLEKTKISQEVAIIVQGPILKESDFTVETLRIYKKIFPGVKIILSTWDDEDKTYINKIRALDIEVIMNKKPNFGGLSNINFQIVSSSKGIFRAKELGFKFALKTRTDQRIYSGNTLSLCYSMLMQYPLSGDFQQNKRIISFNLNTFKYRLYGISDMLNFGEINDLCLYWSPDLDYRKSEDLADPRNLYDFSKQRYAEVYFVTSFLDRIGREIKWTLGDSWDVMARNFCILNVSEIDLFWNKYTKKEFRHQNYNSLLKEQFEFSDWIIHQVRETTQAPEDIIFKEFKDL